MTGHFIDTRLNFRQLFAEAVRDSIQDYYQHPAKRALIKPGFYLVRLGKGRPLVPARIYWCGHEPGNPTNKLEVPFLDGEILGEQYDPALIWTGGMPTTEAEYKYRVALAEHCAKHEPDAPAANPRRAVNLAKMEPLF